MHRIRVAALIVGELRGPELWTLRSIFSLPCELHVVRALGRSTVPGKEQELFRTAPQWIGQWLVGAREEKRNAQALDELFDVRDLRKWWEQCSIVPLKVPELNHPSSRTALEKIAPDIIVVVSASILPPGVSSLARVATLNIHYGQAPIIGGVSSILWGIIENRREWIGATIHLVDESSDTGAILWRGTPQLTPGDDHTVIQFRAHLQAVEALVRLLEEYARGQTPQGWSSPAKETSSYRPAPGLGTWLKFMLVGRGRRARVLIERGIEC